MKKATLALAVLAALALTACQKQEATDKTATEAASTEVNEAVTKRKTFIALKKKKIHMH
jgi:FKBP-type peptidyl-prolyl cis-trans isomerase FkpA